MKHTTDPYPYQWRGAHAIERYNGIALLADDMGLGKTFQSLLWREITQWDVNPTLVICPAGLKYNWEYEAKHHFGEACEILSGREPPPHHRGFKGNHNLIIVNYDILSGWEEYLSDIPFQCVIMDEVQYLSSLKSQRTKTTRRIVRRIPNRVALSGTPLTNRPAEMWPVLNMLWPQHKLFRTFFSFATRYCKPMRRPWGWEFKGAERLDELHATLKHLGMIRRLKSDVLGDLPKKSRHVVPLALSSPKEYREAEKDFIGWLSKLDTAKAIRAMHAENVVKVGYLRRLAAKLKLEAVKTWVQTFLDGTTEKLILFAVHTDIIEELHDAFGKASVVVNGQVTGQKRQKAIAQFHNNPKTRLLIGNIRAAGVGWSCKCASTVAFAELGWTPGEHTQAEDRVYGVGRGVAGVPATAYYLIGQNTYEQDMLRLIQEKQKVLNATLDGEGGGEDVNVFDQLLMILRDRKAAAA